MDGLNACVMNELLLGLFSSCNHLVLLYKGDKDKCHISKKRLYDPFSADPTMVRVQLQWLRITPDQIGLNCRIPEEAVDTHVTALAATD